MDNQVSIFNISGNEYPSSAAIFVPFCRSDGGIVAPKMGRFSGSTPNYAVEFTNGSVLGLQGFSAALKDVQHVVFISLLTHDHCLGMLDCVKNNFLSLIISALDLNQLGIRVYRDMAHLGIACCRALSIPARKEHDAQLRPPDAVPRRHRSLAVMLSVQRFLSPDA
jgi:hypothetical protein